MPRRSAMTGRGPLVEWRHGMGHSLAGRGLSPVEPIRVHGTHGKDKMRRIRKRRKWMASPGDHGIPARLRVSRIERGKKVHGRDRRHRKRKTQAGTDGEHQQHGHAVFFPCLPCFPWIKFPPACNSRPLFSSSVSGPSARIGNPVPPEPRFAMRLASIAPGTRPLLTATCASDEERAANIVLLQSGACVTIRPPWGGTADPSIPSF
jgi:hypothetical protein